MAEEQSQGNIKIEFNSANIGLNMDQTLNQVKSGTLTYALNAALENFDSNSVNYQNEQGNEFCLQFPQGYSLIGTYFINEKNKHIFFLVNPTDGGSEIGYMDNNDCIYNTLVNSACLNFNIDHPIHKCVHRITNCITEIYWTDGYNSRRYLDIENIPYLLAIDSDLCDPTYTKELDCNQLKIQPNFSIPELSITNIYNGGDLTAGTYQFAVQYSDASGNPYTSYYSITNPTPIADTQLTTAIFDYKVGKSIEVTVNNLDTSGLYMYYNIAVIITVNNITTPKLVGTYSIENQVDTVTYTGQNQTLINLSISDIFEKYPYYDIAQDLTSAQDILMWDGLTSIDRINYQEIASQIDLKWETYRIPSTENYSDELNATNLRGYLRDEVYAFEIVFLLKNGKQTDGFHIPGRVLSYNDLQYPDVPNTNADFIGEPDRTDSITGIGYSPYWKIYNTASVIGNAEGNDIGNATPYQYGEFAYWESIEEYPCNVDVWGELAGQKIRHHKFPDVLVSPIFENPSHVLTNSFVPDMQSDAVFPLGVKVDISQVQSLISNSSITQDQKDNIAGFKIVRGNRSTNRSIVAKGMLRNVGTYQREEQTLYYPNYPYNDLNADPFLNKNSNAYDSLGQNRIWIVQCTTTGIYQYTDTVTGKLSSCNEMVAGKNYEFCSLTRPKWLSGGARIFPANYDVVYFDWTSNAYDYGYLKANVERTSNNDALQTDNYGIVVQSGSGCERCYSSPCGVVVAYLTEGTFPYVEDSAGNIQNVDDICTLAPIWTAPLQLGELPPINYTFQDSCSNTYSRRSPLNDSCGITEPLPAITSESSRYRQVFNSPDTSFSQPFLGDVLKLESVMYGAGRAHFVPVKGNAKYRLLSRQAQQDALDSSFDLVVGTTDITAIFTAYQAYLTIYVNGITRKNYAQSFNSIASYDYYGDIPNNTTSNSVFGIKQRQLDLKSYLIPGVLNVGDDKNINNYQRESSIYTKTIDDYDPLPFPNQTPSLLDSSGASLISEYSRFIIGGPGGCDTPAPGDKENYCNTPEKEREIKVVSYYASLKNIFTNQWGQIYSYETIDTGFQRMFNGSSYSNDVVFGGDTFINKFAYKTKLPFFLDNRVNGLDDSDIFYDEIGNVAYPKFWHSARSILYTYKNMTNIVSIKAHNFDCYSDPELTDKDPVGATATYRTFYDGSFYLFAYGVPSFYCESNYNVDVRQAFNDREGDFWPHVSTGIPDDWLQEEFTTIAYDNSYYYNVTFSKQNKENGFTHLPADWTTQLCYTHYPFRVVYSDAQINNADVRVNNWLTYKPLSLFDFPQNYGALVSLDGIQNRAILARFENKSLLYNNLLTMNTSNPQAAYLGNPSIFTNTPIDFAETDLGYVGSQNKMFLKIPQGQITVDAKRGQVFLIQGTKVEEISAFGSGMNRFFTDHLAFEILRYFPDYTEIINNEKVLIKGVDTDNHFNGIGLHGVYDTKFERVILTKLDYIPTSDNVKYDSSLQEFYIENIINNVPIRTQVYLNDLEYFCNKSWTISFNMNTKTWISFHSYIPNFYIGENNFFYSGMNGCCDVDEFKVVAGTIDPVVPTTTTTTTFYPSPTTTTTTTTLNCTLSGEVIITDCVLEGNGIITVPPTTTTTICHRPSSLLTNFVFIQGYTLGTDPEVIFTASLVDACTAIPDIQYVLSPSNIDGSTLDTFTGQANTTSEVLQLGNVVYYGTGTDCTFVSDGWYFAYSDILLQYVYNIVGGVIVNISICDSMTTTTTTTTAPCTGLHPYNYNLIFSTTTVGDFTTSLTNACLAIDCLTIPTCGPSSLLIGWWDNVLPVIGNAVYSSTTGCVTPNVDGYYVIDISGTYSVVEMLDGVIIDFPTC